MKPRIFEWFLMIFACSALVALTLFCLWRFCLLGPSLEA